MLQQLFTFKKNESHFVIMTTYFFILCISIWSLFSIDYANNTNHNKRKEMRDNSNLNEYNDFNSMQEIITFKDYYTSRHHFAEFMLNDEGNGNYISRQIYSDKSQLTAFLLSLFLGGLGAGRLYAGDIDGGLLKLFVFLFIIILTIIIMSCWIKPEWSDRFGGEGPILIMLCIYCVALFGLIINVLIDIMLFAINDIPDQNGLPLRPM